jgi:hypothetical protein
MFGAIPVERGCGTRQEGGVYAECRLSLKELPIEAYLFDPLVKVDCQKLGLTPRSSVLHKVQGTTMVFDWIGSKFYPNPTDWIEEVRRFGMSQRLELNKEQYATLDIKSKLIAVHTVGYYGYPEILDQCTNFWSVCELGYRWDVCPKEHPRVPLVYTGAYPHVPKARCPGIFWQLALPPDQKPETMGLGGVVEIQCPSFAYKAIWNPGLYNLVEETWFPGAFIGLPIHRLVVVRDEKGGTHEKKLKKLAGAKLPVEVVDE